MTAIYRGTQKGGDPALLRSYDSRKEPSPEYDCKIWEAGRATCAIGLAFKPIKIGQSVFHDDGAGTFNPAIQALDEAVVNEWPGRDVGVFISVGTGRRPKSSDANQSLWYEGFLGDFADARKRLIAKIEGCETIHQYVKREHLLKRGVNVENYYRLNVEMGVGEFGMNEWNRLADISTSTRQYLRRPEESAMVQGSAAKLAKIYRAKMRHDRMSTVPDVAVHTTSDSSLPTFAVELPGDMPTFPTKPQNTTPSSRQSYDSGPDSLGMPTSALSPRSSGGSLAGDRPLPPPPPASATGAQPSYTRPSVGSPPSRPTHNPTASTVSAATVSSMGTIDDDLLPAALTPTQWKSVSGQDKIAIVAQDEQPRRGLGPPPLPPKTPIPENHVAGGGRRPPTNGKVPPYPMDDEPPPAVNMAMKPRV